MDLCSKINNMNIVKITKLAIVLLLVLLALGCSTRSNSLLPEAIGEFELAHTMKGKEAEKSVTSMHKGAKMTLLKTEIGDYYAGNYKAKLWVGKAKNETSANILLKRMTKKISKGESPYGEPENITIKSKKVVEMESMGQTHYYYTAKDKVVWLSVDIDLASETISKLVSIVK